MAQLSAIITLSQSQKCQALTFMSYVFNSKHSHYTVQLKGNLTPTRVCCQLKNSGNTHNSQQMGAVPITDVGACKSNLKHLSGHCNQESILSVFVIQLNKKNLLLLTIIQLGIYASIYHTSRLL